MSLAERINLPEVEPSVPRRGNRLSRFLGRLTMAASGWKYEGNFPDEPKFIISIVPHTSNMDFPVGLNILLSMGLELQFLAKGSLFWEPMGAVLRWLGGVPIDRTAPGGVVGQAAEQFEKHEKFVLVITPEGTRSKVDRWKTGFYRIALAADVPIVPAGFDYATKTAKIGEPLWPSGDMEADFARLREFYRDIVGLYPHEAYHGPE